MYSINLTQTKRKFCLSLNYNGQNSYLFVEVHKSTNLKQKIEEINENKYLILDSTELHSIDENKELLKKYNVVFNGIRDKIKETNSDEFDYENDYMKIKFNPMTSYH